MPLEQVICSICNKEYEDSDSALVLECDECRVVPVQEPYDRITTDFLDRFFQQEVLAQQVQGTGFWGQDGIQTVTTQTQQLGQLIGDTYTIRTPLRWTWDQDTQELTEDTHV